MKIKIFLIATTVALTSINAYAADCYVEYDCGDGDISDYNEIDGSSFTPLSPNVVGCSKPGYTFVGWVVSPYTDYDGDMSDLSSYEPIAYPDQTYNLNFVVNGDTCNGAQHESSTSNFLDMRFTAQWFAQPTFSATDIITPTSRAYTDSKMNSKQPAFSGLGANKLMTYGTTDGAVGSRDIVTTLGTSTTANSVPTMGAINTALATKQDTINGNAGWVMANTGFGAGSIKPKPIYSTTNSYRTALVDAQTLNNAVINAVNSELIRVDETGEPNANGTLWKLNDVEHLTLLDTSNSVNVASLDTSTNGTSYCYRGLRETDYSNGTCSAATLSTLGTIYNKSGLWGVVFDYGEIVGKSVCSSQSGTDHTAATDAKESTLNTEFSTQSGVGTSALSGYSDNCWCKMESINGEPAVSRWVYNGNEGAEFLCVDHCASYCGFIAHDSSKFRTSMFNSVQ